MNNVSLSASLYEYKVTLGTVTDKQAIGWHATVRCEDWQSVAKIVEMWEDSRDCPAVEVEVDYLPHRVPSEVETGV